MGKTVVCQRPLHQNPHPCIEVSLTNEPRWVRCDGRVTEDDPIPAQMAHEMYSHVVRRNYQLQDNGRISIKNMDGVQTFFHACIPEGLLKEILGIEDILPDFESDMIIDVGDDEKLTADVAVDLLSPKSDARLIAHLAGHTPITDAQREAFLEETQRPMAPEDEEATRVWWAKSALMGLPKRAIEDITRGSTEAFFIPERTKTGHHFRSRRIKFSDLAAATVGEISPTSDRMNASLTRLTIFDSAKGTLTNCIVYMQEPTQNDGDRPRKGLVLIIPTELYRRALRTLFLIIRQCMPAFLSLDPPTLPNPMKVRRPLVLYGRRGPKPSAKETATAETETPDGDRPTLEVNEDDLIAEPQGTT